MFTLNMIMMTLQMFHGRLHQYGRLVSMCCFALLCFDFVLFVVDDIQMDGWMDGWMDPGWKVFKYNVNIF
jgi:hypothetical protein